MENTVYLRPLTVNRNWTKKIDKLCNNVSEVKVYSLENNFSGETATIPNFEYMKSFVWDQLNRFSFAKLRYDKETGKCDITIHSNLWITWQNKIDW